MSSIRFGFWNGLSVDPHGFRLGAVYPALHNAQALRKIEAEETGDDGGLDDGTWG